MAEKSSSISYTAQFEPASALLQGNNTTNSFALTGLMYPPTSMINTEIIMIQNSCDVYNVLYQIHATILCTKMYYERLRK